MAILPIPKYTNPFGDVIGDDLAPAGTYEATVIDIKDEYDVERQKYQSEETEKVDLETFLFDYRDAAGEKHVIASKRMKISGHVNSSLVGFLTSLLGHAPQPGFDTDTLKGTKCVLSIEHVQRQDGNGVYASIASLSPLPPRPDDGQAAAVQAPTPPSVIPVQAAAGVPPVQPSVAPAKVNEAGAEGDRIPF